MAQKNNANYDKKTSDAIDEYQHGQDLREGYVSRREMHESPELGNPNARAPVGYFYQGRATRAIKESNPGLSDYGVEQTIKVAPRIRPSQSVQDASDKVLGSYRKGTNFVPKTGKYKLHKGEAVIPASKNKARKKSDYFYGG